MASILKAIQQTVTDRLAADSYFSNIAVISENIGDIETAIQIALQKTGICALVVTPTANAAFPDYLVPYYDNIRIIVRIVENVVLNRSQNGTGKPAPEAAEVVAALLHQYSSPGISENIFLDNPSITIANTGGTGRLLSYDVRLRTAGGISYVVNTVATPTINVTSGTATLACSTPGAAIFYTTDGSTPTPGTPSVHVWTGTGFGVSSGTTIRAAGWLTGLLTSPEAKKLVT